MLEFLDGLPVTPGQIHLAVGLLTIYLLIVIVRDGWPVVTVVLGAVVQIIVRNPTYRAYLKDLLHAGTPESTRRLHQGSRHTPPE